MTREQIERSVKYCTEVVVNEVGVSPDETDEMHHLLLMLDRVLEHWDAGRIEKAQRWLSFVHGALWCAGAITIEQCKRSLMPAGEEYREDA